MAQDATKIHIGAARIFLGVTAPATGNPPTYLTHTAGVPGTGTEAGFTDGDTVFSYKSIKEEIKAEQSLSAVGIFVSGEECMLEFNAMEHVYNTMKTAFDNIGTASGAGKESFWAGDSTTLQTVTTQCVVFTAQQRADNTKYEVGVMYKVYNVEGIQIAYGKTKPAIYKVTLKGLADSTRQAGDRLFQFYREI